MKTVKKLHIFELFFIAHTLRVNYCLLDSDKIFVTFVLKQLNLIEESQMHRAPMVIPDIFKFLVLLSYEKHHSKPIIDVPKILHLCEGKYYEIMMPKY